MTRKHSRRQHSRKPPAAAAGGPAAGPDTGAAAAGSSALLKKLISIDASHLATMCGPLMVPDGHCWNPQRHVTGEDVLGGLYGRYTKIKPVPSGSALELSKSKLLASIKTSLDLLNCVDVPHAESKASVYASESESDVVLSSSDDEGGVTARKKPIESPQLTILDSSKFPQKKPNQYIDDGDIVPQHIAKSMATFFT